MYKKISARLSAAISTAQEERKYVLEDVFWVPECNSKARHLDVPAPPEPCSEGRATHKTSNGGRRSYRHGSAG
jgi:hypothetical protein